MLPIPIELMQKAIDFARAKNPIWPFSALIVDEKGKVLCQATDCAHISPIYHAESLAIHILIQNRKKFPEPFEELTLVTTAEPDVLSQSTICWSRVVQELPIKQVIYGLSFEGIQKLWPFGINISAREILERSSQKGLSLEGGVHEEACLELFKEAKKRQQAIGQKHPAVGQLSYDVEDFYALG